MTSCVQSWSPENERPRALAAAVQLTALLMANSHVPVLRVRYAVAEAHAPKPASAKIARLADRIDARNEFPHHARRGRRLILFR